MAIKAQRYGQGLRWHCTICDTKTSSIIWTNSSPPVNCPKCKQHIDGGFPIYILDDDRIEFEIADLGHTEYWVEKVAAIVAAQNKLNKSQLVNLPYCQRRGRIVGDILYCGEKISKDLLRKIESATGVKDLKVVFDDHEIRCDYDLRIFKGLLRKKRTAK